MKNFKLNLGLKDLWDFYLKKIKQAHDIITNDNSHMKIYLKR